MDGGEGISRREALTSIAALGAGVVLVACGSKSHPLTTPLPQPVNGAAQPACVLTPEATEGPYYLDLDEVRQDITEGRPGVPLTLAITTQDSVACTPIKGAAVDIWHCDALGDYSGFGAATGTGEMTFLRGTQLTDGDGKASFTTLYPGWYRGRAVHIHVKVRAGGKTVHTGQFFFDDTTTDAVYQSAPYSSRGQRDTRNNADGIFRDAGGSAALVHLEPAAGGYSATVTVGVRPA